MIELIRGGIYTLSGYKKQCFILLTDDIGELSLFKVKTVFNNNETIVKYLNTILKIYDVKELDNFFITMNENDFQDLCDGYLGQVPEEMLDTVHQGIFA